jgi:hypothetical protein
VVFNKQYASDSSFRFSAPGKLVSIHNDNFVSFKLYADMTNSAFYTIARIKTFAPLRNLDQKRMKLKSLNLTNSTLHHARDVVSVNAPRDASIRMIQILQLIKLLPQI